MKLSVDIVYVMHYKPLSERLEHVKQMMQSQSIDFTVFDMEPEKDLNEYFIDSLDTRKKKLSSFSGNQITKDVKRQEISLAYKHVKALEHMVKNKYQKALFLEDDAILCNDFSSIANHFIEQTPEDWDMIFPGNGCNLRIHPSKIKQNQVAYKKEHPATKCTDSYFIKLSAAEKLLTTIKPFNIAIDWELNYQLKIHDFNVYWFEPFLVQQGSSYNGVGMWKSTIQ